MKRVFEKKLLMVWVLAVCMQTALACGRPEHPARTAAPFVFVTAENLHSIARAGEKLWISGNYGTILHSPDGGRIWQEQESGVPEVLLGCISFVDKKFGWAAGVGGTIVSTRDGGATWAAQNSGTEHDLLDLFMLDRQHGWAVGENATIIHTRDGGSTWESQSEPADTMYNDVFFIDRLHGWVVGEFGTILRTGTAGRTWQPVACPDPGGGLDDEGWEQPLPALYGIFFTDERQGWIVGMDGLILHTVDGGVAWSRVLSGTDLPLYAVVVSGIRGWAVGNRGVYLRSWDEGRSWQRIDDAVQTKFWLRDIAVWNDCALIVGARGTIALSGDGGSTWSMLSGFSYSAYGGRR